MLSEYIRLMEAFGWISALLFGTCYIPQLYRTIRLRSVEDISIMMWVLVAGACLTGLIYAVSIRAVPLIVNYSFELVLTIIFMILYVKYRR